MDLEITEVFHQDHVGRVALAQLTHRHTVMLHGIDAGGTKHVEHIVTEGRGPCAQPIDVPDHQTVRMHVVGAEHEVVRMVVHQADQGFEVPGGTPFTDKDAHAMGELVQRFFPGEAFVIGADTGGDVFSSQVAPQSGCVAVHGFSQPMGMGDLRHHFVIAVEHTGKVHHFGQVAHIGTFQQLSDRGRIDARPGRFVHRGGHTTRCTEEEPEGHLGAIVDHVFYACHAEHVRDLVRVAHGGHGPMHNGQPREFGRDEQAALHMNVRINETG